MGEVTEFDLIAIGAGPGGEGAAMTAAKAGKRVAVVDRNSQVGGSNVHRGTIPSKALRQEVQRLNQLRADPVFQPAVKDLDVTYPKLLQSAASVISQQVGMRTAFFERNDVDVFSGTASFVDAHTIDIDLLEGGTRRLRAEKFIIAVGARPYQPTDIDFDHPRVLTSDTVLALDDTPDSITIVGAGVIGCEYASIFRLIDCKVNLVNNRDKLLSFLDDEIIDALSYHLRDRGVIIRHNENYDKVEPDDDGVVLTLQSGKRLKTDYLLWAAGRTGNTDQLNLPAIGIEPNSRQQIEVDENYATDLGHVYAVGDVVGYPGLASAAYDQGRFASIHAMTGECNQRLVELIPTGIYTSPEVSSVGKTERELTDSKVPYEVGHALFRSLARAQIVGERTGMLKLLFHRETLELLGVHCFGYQASEIVHIGQAIMSQPGAGNSIEFFANTTFNYPTMAEAYRVAALNGLNRLF